VEQSILQANRNKAIYIYHTPPQTLTSVTTPLFFVLFETQIDLKYIKSYLTMFCAVKEFVFKNTTAVIYFSVSVHLTKYISLFASSIIPISPQQIYVCSFCACNKFHFICLLYCPF